jgi:4-alpha-glucanotransferase
MDDSRLDEFAERFGIAPGYRGANRKWVATPLETKRVILKGMGLDLDAPDRRAPAKDRPAGGSTPTGCYLPDWLLEQPAWGITGQLYELRSSRSWGIGDFADLELLCRIAARQGADFVGLTPLHAPFLAAPERCSPFSPSNRRFLNPLYIAVDEVEGYDEDQHRADRLLDLAGETLVDYASVATAKLSALRTIWAAWRARRVQGEALKQFAEFGEAGGDGLRRHALFEAISARMAVEGHGAGWRKWPEDYQSADGEAVAEFARENADEIGFHIWLQFLADRQLAAAAKTCREAGMRIGLYLDLAVGEAPDGSATWSAPETYVTGAMVGAPPDYFSRQGQDWGIVALSPLALESLDLAPFTETIEGTARHAGALRIDHVMALRQLFLVPEGTRPTRGAHLRYPIGRLLDRLAALSNEKRFIVIGEDLGHVPEGFREIMQEAAILSYRILYFEQTEEGFRPGKDYPRHAIACLATHDLPTFRGWWRGHDVELRLEPGLIDRRSAGQQARNRKAERRALIEALLEGAPTPGEWRSALKNLAAPPPDSLAVAVHGFLASSNALLAGVRIADLLGEEEPTNLPGVSDAYPNWRRRMAVPLEDLEDQPLFRDIASRMAMTRPRG